MSSLQIQGNENSVVLVMTGHLLCSGLWIRIVALDATLTQWHKEGHQFLLSVIPPVVLNIYWVSTVYPAWFQLTGTMPFPQGRGESYKGDRSQQRSHFCDVLLGSGEYLSEKPKGSGIQARRAGLGEPSERV